MVQSDENSINQMAIIILQFYYYYLCHFFRRSLSLSLSLPWSSPFNICVHDIRKSSADARVRELRQKSKRMEKSTQKAHNQYTCRFTGFIVIFMEWCTIWCLFNTNNKKLSQHYQPQPHEVVNVTVCLIISRYNFNANRNDFRENMKYRDIGICFMLLMFHVALRRE